MTEKLSHREILAMMEPVGCVAASPIDPHGKLRFSFNHCRPQWASEDKVAAVYAWVIGADRDTPEIIYIGKAGRGLVARCRQHEQGFKEKDGKGKSNGDKLIVITARERVELYAMYPEAVSFRGVSIPSHSAVEDWLLSASEPPPSLNRESAAKARLEAIALGTHVPKARKRKRTDQLTLRMDATDVVRRLDEPTSEPEEPEA